MNFDPQDKIKAYITHDIVLIIMGYKFCQCLNYLVLNKHCNALIIGIFLNYMATKALMENKQCGMTFFKVGISIFFYVTYAILFGNFFYWTYIHKKETNEATKVVSGTTTVNGSVSNGIPNAKAIVASRNGVSSSYNRQSRKN